MIAGSLAALREQLADEGLNIADVKPNQGSGAIPKGHYTLEVVHYQQTVSGEQSQNPGALLYKVGFQVASGEYKGTRAWLNCSVTKATYVRRWGLMLGLFTACGIPKDECNSNGFEPDDEWGRKHVLSKLVESDVYVTPPRGEFQEGNGFNNFTEHVMTTDDLLND